MRVSEGSWLEYIDGLRKLSDEAADQFSVYLYMHDISSKAGRQAAIDYAYALATKYGEGAAALSCEMYDAVAAASKAPVPAAEPAETPTYGEVAKTVNGTLKQSNSPELPGQAIGRLVKRTGVDTTIKNAIRDGAEWAWIPHGDTCAFCITLASRGWQRASHKALKGGHAEHIHANCDCTYAIRFDRKTEYAGYDPEKYLAAYQNAEGKTWQDKVNAMRRGNYAKDGDRIREQKRIAYARKNNEAKRVSTVHEKIFARPMDAFIVDDEEMTSITPQQLLDNMSESPIGRETIQHITDSKAIIFLNNEVQSHSNRGDQRDNAITLYLKNMKNLRVAGQTTIHEMTHLWYNIGGSQHAEAVCFAMEKMHILKRDYLTPEEWQQMVDLAVQNYPELKWEEGGYGDFSQFKFVREHD